MSEKAVNSEHEALLARYLTGEATIDECMKAEELIASDNVYKEYINKFLFIQESIIAPKLINKYNAEAAYDDFLDHIKNKPGRPKKKKGIKIALKIFKYAAIFVAVLMLWKTGNYINWYNQQLFTSVNESKSKLLQLKNYSLRNEVQVLQSYDKVNETIILPDNSKVILNSESTMNYPNSFSKKARIIQFEGEAYFNIEDYEDIPFIIETKKGIVKVVGTSFNLSTYNTSEKMELTVDTGSVKVINSDIKGNEIETEVAAGEKIIYSTIDKTVEKEKVSDKNYLAWSTKVIEFNESSFEEIIHVVQHAYRVKIILKNEKIKNCKLTANFNNRPISFIFDILKLNFNIEITHDGDIYFITGVGCINN